MSRHGGSQPLFSTRQIITESLKAVFTTLTQYGYALSYTGKGTVTGDFHPEHKKD